MSQLSLFDSPRPVEKRPPDLNFIRKSLNRVLRLLRNAQWMPWREDETASWEKQFPLLAAMLPAEEGAEMLAAFQAGIERLRKTEGK